MITHNLTSDYQEGNTPLSVWLPDSYDKRNKYRVLYVLPVGVGIEKDVLELIKRMDVHNQFNILIAYPSMAVMPWFGDHATNPKIRQESYLKNFLIPFIEGQYSTYGNNEGRMLVGFSKGGWAAFSLLLRNPDFFGYSGSWDAPMFADKLMYGMEENFGTVEQMKLYEPASLVRKQQKYFKDRTRFVLTGEESWGQLQPSPAGISHTSEMYEVMKNAGIKVKYDNHLKIKHTWNDQWLTVVIKYLIELVNKN